MSARRLFIHPVNPQPRLLSQAVHLLGGGAVAAVPTDSSYALVCHLDDKPAVDQIRRLRGIDERHHLTLLCRDLSEIASYAKVDNAAYRLLRQATPGPYTFILEATKEVPRRLSHPSRKTIGIRIPDNPVLQMLLEEHGAPLISTSLQLPGDEIALNDPDDIEERLGSDLELIVDGGMCGVEPTTIIDLSGRDASVIRRGRGPLEPLGLA
jgi:tRNA threonylcarbamoyl adenosine modification protein (Sua5/YciO/YrdC/YwlC family)